MSRGRRVDLQGVRGYAILLVVLFHLWPKEFPNGFVGVDIFFVLSGFFMSSHYGQRTVDLKSHLEFYSRRVCRLHPMYFLIFPPTLWFATRYFVDDDFDSLRNELEWAVLFMRNIKGLFEWRDYFTRVETISYFVHTWSLCCEMQYYLVAPILFFFERRRNLFGTLVLVSVSATSLLLHVFLTGSWSYEMLPSRLWQFQCGYLAFRLKNLGSPLSAHVSTFLLHFFFLPFPVPQVVARVLGSALAVILISQHSKTSSSSALLTNKFVTYLGDISYVWYLSHWIVKVFIYYTSADMHFSEKVQIVIISLAVSIFVHHTLEKPLLRDRFSSLLFTVLCLATTAYFFYLAPRDSDRFFTMNNYPCSTAQPNTYWANWTYINPCAPYSERVKQAIKVNALYKLKNWYPPHYRAPNESDYKCEAEFWNWQGHVDGNGTLKVLVIGNSYAVKMIPAVLTVLEGKYAVVENFMFSGCEPLINEDVGEGCCAQLTRFMFKKTREMKPDLLFLIHRYRSAFSEVPFDRKNDSLVYIANERLARLQKHTKQIFISGSMPMFDRGIGPEVARRLKMELSLESLFFTRDVRHKTCLSIIYRLLSRSMRDSTKRRTFVSLHLTVSNVGL
uniref:Acyl_transf_3 domain-containing protein n=2 Tax=Steinernema glaseri TaxID=37863 RepID=A0A1I8AHH6_9BILA